MFGPVAGYTWLWTLNPSLAYVGQGIIMGPATTLHMLLGAVVGWGILSPLAKYRGWAPGPVDDWQTGSKGWIVWTSLAIMLADAVVSLGHVALQSLLPCFPAARDIIEGRYPGLFPTSLLRKRPPGYTSVAIDDDGSGAASVPPSPLTRLSTDGSAVDDADYDANPPRDDAPPDQQIGNAVVWAGLILSVIFCIVCIHIVFGQLVPLYATAVAVLMALVLSIMGVRALGEVSIAFTPSQRLAEIAPLTWCQKDRSQPCLRDIEVGATLLRLYYPAVEQIHRFDQPSGRSRCESLLPLTSLALEI